MRGLHKAPIPDGDKYRITPAYAGTTYDEAERTING